MTPLRQENIYSNSLTTKGMGLYVISDIASESWSGFWSRFGAPISTLKNCVFRLNSTRKGGGVVERGGLENR